jgi:hypothetical protein
MRTSTTLLLALLASGCAYSEDALQHFDVRGKVRIPKDMTTVTVNDPETGEAYTIENDVRAIGPVWLGVFSGVDDRLFDYPHPEVGPVLGTDNPTGNTYPYGSMSVGRPDWGCYQTMNCKLITGRYSSYDDVIGFFRDEVRDPVINQLGDEVTSGIEYREHCYETGYLTSDQEVGFIGNGGGEPYFEDMGDYFEAETTIYHTLWLEGAVVWGWMDAPSRTFDFSTCQEGDSLGWQVFYYDEQYFTGQVPIDLLNFPSKYIFQGDVVVQDPPVIDDPDKEFTVELSFRYE